MLWLGYASEKQNLRALKTVLLEPGVGWLQSKAHGNVPQGWLSWGGFVNQSQPLYAALKAGLKNMNASDPTIYSATAFNAVLATANVLDTMFLRSTPPVYTSNQVCLHCMACGVI